MKFLALAAVALPLVFAQTEDRTKGLTNGILGSANVITGNPTNVTYEAIFSNPNGINGKFVFTAGKGGKGVSVNVNLKGFDVLGKPGPFKYHIHDQPVPADGNCTGTKAHLDPYIRGQQTPCDISKPETCEVGDLIGKHVANGTLPANTEEYINSYTDDFLSLSPAIAGGSFIGNRSVVIHGVNATRIACVNITVGAPSTSTNSTVKPTPKPDDDDKDSEDDETDGGAVKGGQTSGDSDKPSDSAAGVNKAGVLGLSVVVAGVVGLLL